jgi:hypothetical protein
MYTEPGAILVVSCCDSSQVDFAVDALCLRCQLSYDEVFDVELAREQHFACSVNQGKEEARFPSVAYPETILRHQGPAHIVPGTSSQCGRARRRANRVDSVAECVDACHLSIDSLAFVGKVCTSAMDHINYCRWLSWSTLWWFRVDLHCDVNVVGTATDVATQQLYNFEFLAGAGCATGILLDYGAYIQGWCGAICSLHPGCVLR